MRAELGNLILLAMLLMPGIVAGSIVSWRTRSPLALFITIGSSLASCLLVTLVGTVACYVLAPFFPFLSKTNSWFPIGIYVYAFLLPIGLISGATLSGMLLLVRHRLKRMGKKLNFSALVISGIGSITASVGFSLLLILVLGISHYVLPSGVGYSLGSSISSVVFCILGLVGNLACGLFSAIAGVKLANILR